MATKHQELGEETSEERERRVCREHLLEIKQFAQRLDDVVEAMKRRLASLTGR
jgi:hypothetical protein